MLSRSTLKPSAAKGRWPSTEANLEALNYLMMAVAGTGFYLLLSGCASADQRMLDKTNYRQAQVSMVQAQERARTERETAQAVETAAMWAALAEIVKADPDASGMVAMVAAVSAARDGDAPGSSTASMVTLKTEHETTALDWVKVLANPVTNIGIAALNMDLQKTIAKQNTLVDLASEANRAKMMDTFATLGSRDTTSYNVSDEAFVDLSSTVTTTTSGDTTSGDTISDSYNTTETTTDSYNTTETTSGDTHTDSHNTTDSSDNSTTDSSDNSDNSVTNPPAGP
jgi:hypothetical protein